MKRASLLEFRVSRRKKLYHGGGLRSACPLSRNKSGDIFPMICTHCTVGAGVYVNSQMKRAASFAAFMLLFTATFLHAQSNKTVSDQDGKAEYAYILTMERFNKLEEVSRAVREWADSNEQISEMMEKDNSLVDGPLAQRARIAKLKYPAFADITRKYGLSVQEYLLGTQVEVHAILALEAKTRGETKGYSKNVNPANLRFVKQHLQEIRENTRFRM